jgi:redox-sensitive bicupin YhaK (pirin superfamily)
MYHGDTVPGFPGHPHRGFETVTLVRKGLIDHSDSLGAAARFGGGDVQWVTAGKGIVHSEMFPLLNATEPNPLELFQIWLNLPAKSKMVEPHFTMLWNERIPRLVQHRRGRPHHHGDRGGRCAAGRRAPLAPPPESWASQPRPTWPSGRCTWSPAHAGRCPPPPARARAACCISLGATACGGPAGRGTARRAGAGGRAGLGTDNTGTTPVECLLLQGQPIGEPVAQYGPFVMNTQAEESCRPCRTTAAPSLAAGPGLTMRPSTGATRRASRAIPTAGWSARQPMKRREP